MLRGELFDANEQFAFARRFGSFQVRLPVADELRYTGAVLRRCELGSYAECLRVGSCERRPDGAADDRDRLSTRRAWLWWWCVLR